ncbi:MAG: methyltransferase domain-containing protein [Saccharothrix sp.]|nr:methyltransferase domain-containing protein [Saccharothrix sp.]
MRAVRLVARTVRGVESLAAREISGVGVVESVGHREVWFSAVPGPAVLGLRCVDDVFLVAAVVPGIGRSRADLRRLSDLDGHGVDGHGVGVRAVVRLREAFGFTGSSTVDVSASFLGRRNFTRYDVEDAVGVPLAARLGMAYAGRRDGRVPPAGGLSWRVTVVDDRAVVGLRIADRPLHRRPYRRVSRPGALHPPVAAAMVRLAGPGARLLDPFCGTGTIGIEAVDAGTVGTGAGGARTTGTGAEGTWTTGIEAEGARTTGIGAAGAVPAVLGVDVDPGAIAAAVANTPVPGSVAWAVGDAGRLPVASGSVDVVVGNPPWGRQVAVAGAGGVGRFWGEVRRVLVPGGRAVLLVPDADPWVRGTGRRGLTVVERRPIGLAGARPEVVTLVADW